MLLWALAAFPSRAFDLLHVETARLEFPAGWIEGLRLRIHLQAQGPAFALEADRIHLPGDRRLEQVRVACPRVRIEGGRLRCPGGRLAFTERSLGRLRYGIAWRYDRNEGRFELRLESRRRRPFRSARLRLHTRDELKARLEVAGIAPGRLAEWLARLGGQTLPFELSGTGTLHAGFHRRRSGWQWQAGGTLRRLTLSNPEGTLAAEDGRLAWRAQGRWAPGRTSARFALEWQAGALYADPVYVEVSGNQAPLRFEASVRPEGKGLVLEGLRYRHPGVVALAVERLPWPLPARPELSVHLDSLDLGAAWPLYLQPWLAGTRADDLRLSGRMQGQLRFAKGRIQRLRLLLADGRVMDRLGHIELEGLGAEIEHARDGRRHASRIHWRSGRLYRIALGAAELPLVSEEERWTLAGEADLPVLDGHLLVDRIFVELPGSNDAPPRWGIDAVLTPLSLPRLCQALGWPRFEGTFSGVIPEVRYARHRLSVGGVLLAQVFDGFVRVRHLVLERPFGRFPRLTADIEFDHLDLEPLTSAFSFGRIEGRLSGYVRHLVMEDWEPVAFDAWFGTPEDFRGRRRISQRAVENLSSIGGGASGVLSRSLLRVFENFPYERLGIGCRLERGVCHMRGVAPAPQGYYLVKGRLLPRLDVVGYATEVDWNTLLERLRAVTRSGEANIR